jgi:predicted signal transduction protein with EAL and GGDEF domain
VIGDGAWAFFRTDSFAAAAQLVQPISQLPGVDQHDPDVDLRDNGVTVRLITSADDYFGMRRDIELGGDEFALVLPSADLGQAIGIAGRLQDALSTPLIAQGFRLTPEGSIGIATCPDHGSDGETLMRHADVALYIAKRSAQRIATYDGGKISASGIS